MRGTGPIDPSRRHKKSHYSALKMTTFPSVIFKLPIPSLLSDLLSGT